MGEERVRMSRETEHKETFLFCFKGRMRKLGKREQRKRNKKLLGVILGPLQCFPKTKMKVRLS